MLPTSNVKESINILIYNTKISAIICFKNKINLVV